MSRLAVVRITDNIIINMIVGEIGTTLPQEGCFLIDVDNCPYADIGWKYDPIIIDFIPLTIDSDNGN